MRTIEELVSGGLVALWMVLLHIYSTSQHVCSFWPARRVRVVGRRPVRRQWAIAGQLGGRIVGVRIQLVALPV